MEPEELERTLERLHEELSGNPDLSDEARALLRDVASDIRALRERAETPAKAETGDFVDRLREATADFGTAHPTLTETVERLADMLGKMGI